MNRASVRWVKHYTNTVVMVSAVFENSCKSDKQHLTETFSGVQETQKFH